MSESLRLVPHGYEKQQEKRNAEQHVHVDKIALYTLSAICAIFILVIPSHCEFCANNTVCNFFCNAGIKPQLPMIIALVCLTYLHTGSHVPFSTANTMKFVWLLLGISILLLATVPVTDPEQFDMKWREDNGCGSTIKSVWNPQTEKWEKTIKEGQEGTCPAIQVAIRKKFCSGRGVLTDRHGNEYADADQPCWIFMYAHHARNTSKDIITALDTQFNMLPYIEKLAQNCNAAECSEAVVNIEITESFRNITAMIAVSVCVFVTVSGVELQKNNFFKEFLLKVVYLYVLFTAYNMWHSDTIGMETVLHACHSILSDLIGCINNLVNHFETQGGGSVVITLAFVFSNLGVIVWIPLVMSYLPNAAGATDLVTLEALAFKQHQQEKQLTLDCYAALPWICVASVVYFRLHQKQYGHCFVMWIMIVAMSYVKAQIVQLLDYLYISDLVSLFIGKTNILGKVEGSYLILISVLNIFIGWLQQHTCVGDLLHMYYASAGPARQRPECDGDRTHMHAPQLLPGTGVQKKKKRTPRGRSRSQEKQNSKRRSLTPAHRRRTEDDLLALQNA